ncbi:MAG: aldehyde dehydrogenase family protein [Candidatus Binatia bacterium]|nr:aldehyde dehydrogenase family protein [Candidatus Binatia bacterium]
MPALMEVRSPFDGAVAGTVPMDSSASVDRKLSASVAAFARWRETSLTDRRRIVEEGLSRFLDESTQIAREITLQMGKPLVQANQEVETFLDIAHWALEALAPEILPEGEGLHRRIEHVPVGVVLDIAAWNYPLLVPVNEASLMQDETFGPIVPVAVVDDDDQALGLMQDTRFGLTASVWTTDRGRAEHFAARLDAGTIFQNRCDFADPGLPWSGSGESGVGSTLSRHGFLALTRRRSIHFG